MIPFHLLEGCNRLRSVNLHVHTLGLLSYLGLGDNGEAAGHLNDIFFVLGVEVLDAVDRLVDLGVHLLEDHIVVDLSRRLATLTTPAKERALGIDEGRVETAGSITETSPSIESHGILQGK